jgi:A/G-specific adenine glycosylase
MNDLSLPDPITLSVLDKSSRNAALRMFSDALWDSYATLKRAFPWRETDDPYRILLSELMLQQTQTDRVLPKYQLFLAHWPSFREMAQTEISDVLLAWRGLGYNRRALALRTIARESERFGWTLPADYDQLIQMPMIGPATAAAILAFAYQKPAIYLETNIRRVLIHQFHPDESQVTDTVLKGELEDLLQFQTDYRHWYYALMDYGVYLKKVLINPNRRSAHYAKQSKFAGSNRQLRGLLLVSLTEQGALDIESLAKRIDFPRERIAQCLEDLIRDGFIEPAEQVAEDLPIRYGIASDR